MPDLHIVSFTTGTVRAFRGLLLASTVTAAVWGVCPAAHSAPKGGRLAWKPLGEPGSGGAIVGLAISPHDSRRLLVSGDMLGVGLSEDGGKSWQPTFGFTSWEMADFSWHPKNSNVVWVGSMSGPYLSRDGGRHWEPRRNGMPSPSTAGYSAPTERVLFDPGDPEHLVAFGGSSRSWHSPGRPLWGAVWESRNGGADWKRLTTLALGGANDSPDAGVNVNAAAYGAGSAPVLYAGARGYGLWASGDGGKTWESRTAGLPSHSIERIVTHPTQHDTLFVSLSRMLGLDNALVPGGVYKSTDAGKHWAPLSTGLSQAASPDEHLSAAYPGFAVSASNPDVMYAGDSAWNTGILYGSRDGGRSWTALASKGSGAPAHVETAYPAGLGLTVLAVDPRNPEHVIGGGSEFVVGSTDGGKSWSDLTAIRGRLAQTWQGTGFSGLVATNFRWDPVDGKRAVFQGMDAGKFWLSTDALKSWTRTLNEPSPWGGATDVSFAAKFIYVALGQNGEFDGIARSDDRGATWKLFAGSAHGLPELRARETPNAGLYARPETPDIAWACIGGRLYHTMDFGEHWQALKVGPGVRWITRDLARPLHFWVSGERSVYETLDGEQFRAIGGPRGAGKMTVDSLGRLLVAADGAAHGGVWRYNGRAWSRLSDEPWTADVAVDPMDPDRLALTTNQNPYTDVSSATGVWISADGGKSWCRQNDGLAMLRGSVIRFNPHDSEELVWGSNGRGFWTTRWSRRLRVAGERSYRSTAEDERFAGQIVP